MDIRTFGYPDVYLDIKRDIERHADEVCEGETQAPGGPRNPITRQALHPISKITRLQKPERYTSVVSVFLF
jgi:hypothetical protein